MTGERRCGYEAELQRHNEVLRRACGVGLHDHVLDIGCGTGQTTREAAGTARAGRNRMRSRPPTRRP